MRMKFLVLLLFAALSGLGAGSCLPASMPQTGSVAEETPVPPSPNPPPTQAPLPILAPAASPTAFTLPTIAFADAESIRILEPAARTKVVAGQLVTFAGVVTPIVETSLTLRLKVAYQEIYAISVPFDGQTGAWSLTTTLPPVAGAAELSVTGAESIAAVQFEIAPPADMPGPLVTLARPVVGETAVAGYALYLGGEARDLLDDRLYMAVLANNCTETAAAFSIELTTGAWNGELVLPASTTPGPACVVAYTGTRGEGSWLEARIPITILAANDPRASFIRLGNTQNLTFQAGAVTEVYGIAINAPNHEVQLTLTRDEADGGALLQATTADVDTFGYWRADLALAEGATGSALLTVSMGEGSNYVELRQKTAVLP